MIKQLLRFTLPLLSVVFIGCAKSSQEAEIESNLKPRLVVMTDIGPADIEPDDNESAVRLLAYADKFEIEAIITTIGWNCDPYPPEWADFLYKVIDAYEIDVNNLMKRSGQSEFMPLELENGAQEIGYWPSVEYIRNRAMMGSVRAGIDVVGEGNDSPGSDFLIELADEPDPRPIWVTSWGGANTLAQAIWKVKQTRTPEELKKFVNKFRVYTITDQDMRWDMRMDRAYSSHQWMRSEFRNDLKFVWDESAWLNQNALGVENWDKYVAHIQPMGEMGKTYPNYLWGVEGDTPSFLNVMPNGLNDAEDPTQAGWGGYHTFNISPDSITFAWTNWQEPSKSISDMYEKHFYPDEFNDFAARMAWAGKGEGNRNPKIVINGNDGLRPIKIKVRPGKTVMLDASESYDEDGDNITYQWWQQADHNHKHSILGNSSKLEFTTPADASLYPINIVCEAHDDGDFNLVAYRRVIIQI